MAGQDIFSKNNHLITENRKLLSKLHSTFEQKNLIVCFYQKVNKSETSIFNVFEIAYKVVTEVFMTPLSILLI